MYMIIHAMAKTIMVANDVYAELKARKGEKSFSELFVALMKGERRKTGKDLLSHYGALAGDKEFDAMRKEREGGWKRWRRSA